MTFEKTGLSRETFLGQVSDISPAIWVTSKGKLDIMIETRSRTQP
jgi:hypothetical protein